MTLIGSLLFTSCSVEDKETAKPNIIFILADDLGWADLPTYGNKFNEAPALEKLASEGMTFNNAYAACPVCSPTRASIQTGQYPARIGILDFIPGHWRPYEKVTVPINRVQALPNEAYTIGEVMKDAGYITGYYGKWHLGYDKNTLPKAQGYDSAIVFNGGPFFNVGPKMTPRQKVDPTKVLSEVLTDFSLDFIDSNKDKPFFLTLAHYDVHVQLDADTSLIHHFLNKEKVDGYPCNAIYAAMIKHIDNSLARIEAKLKEHDLSDNTMIIFYSDNGGLVMRFDKIPLIAKPRRYIYEGDTLMYVASSNAPLRNEKGTVFEGGIREPMIVKWPNKVTAGSKTDAVISSVDLLPTLAEIGAVNIPENVVVDGKSMLPTLLENNHDYERPIFWHYPVYHHDVPASAIRKGDWKLIEYLDDNTVELYNLSEDIGESNDLSETNTAKKEELLGLLQDWRESLNADMPVSNPEFDENKRYEWGIHPDRERLFGKKKQLMKDVIPK